MNELHTKLDLALEVGESIYELCDLKEKKFDEKKQRQRLLLLGIVMECFELEGAKMVLEQMFSFRKRVLEAQRN